MINNLLTKNNKKKPINSVELLLEMLDLEIDLLELENVNL